jgi:integrase
MSRGTVDKRISERTGKVSWVARWSFVSGTGRRQHRERSFSTRKEAIDFLTKVQHELRSQTYIEPSREPVSVYLANWHASLTTQNRTSSTLFAYGLMVRLRFTSIADVPLADLSPAHIEKLFTVWEADGLASHTQNSAYRVLRVALKDAVRAGKLAVNPTDQMKAPKIKRYLPATWNADEIKQFLAFTADTPDGLMWEFVFRTLVRKGELISLQWGDIDFDARTLHVHRTVRRRLDGGWEVGTTPKSDASARVIPLGAELVARLKQHRAAQRAAHLELGIPWSEASWIFERRDRIDGDRHQGSAVCERWKSAVVRSGLKPIRLHDARHSGATLMINSGVPIKTVSQLLGHSDISFTLKIYIHPGQEDKESAIDVLDRMLDAG